MDALKQAITLLQETESKLRGLLSNAATAGDYATVVRIAAWARGLSDLVNGTSGVPGNRTALQSDAPARKDGRSSTEIPKTKHSAPKQAQKTYPIFLRHDDQVVRLAWSKREKKEYRHKVPLAALKTLTKTMAEKGADGRVISTDQFLPIRDAAGVEIPNYQSYVGISLLKHTGLIDQHGRQGYSIPRIADFKDAAEAVWKKLPER